MSQYKRIATILGEKIGKVSQQSPFYPKTPTVMSFNILTTKRATQTLKEMEIDLSEFNGNPAITLHLEKIQLTFPDHIFSIPSLSLQNLELERYVESLLINEEFSIKLQTNKVGGIFKWLSDDGQLLLITLYKIDPKRSRNQRNPLTPYAIRLIQGDRSATSYPKLMAKIVYQTLTGMKNAIREQFDASYRKFLDHAFQPFNDFLYNEMLAIRDPKYRPKSKYVKRIIEGRENDEQGYLELTNPPRQITEGGNSVVPAGENKSKRYSSARITDYDEFNSLLIFESGFRIKNWPEEGTLLLEGDMASNRRKRNAIRQLKSRGLAGHAKLADVLIRPWGLPNVNPIRRTYFNTGISHDDHQSHPQAQAIDIALSTPDVALIHGPPGTGKTTVIVEIIRHVISNGGRVIMCAPTHVAVDNVLERTTDIKGISAIRVGGSAYMDDDLRKFRLDEKIKSFDRAMPSFIKAKGKDQILMKSQVKYATGMEAKGKNYLENLAIQQANLICGTTIGIARFEPPKDNPIDFDVLIIDEASKATLMEFLVPAVRAKKWILVGDHRQLAPYINEQEIRIYVQRYFEDMKKGNGKPKNGDDQDKASNNETNDEIPAEEEEFNIYDDQTNDLIASLRRFHEELHALEDGQPDYHWKRVLELFDFSKKPIKSIEEMTNFALGSCFHYFLKRIDQSRNARLLVQHRMPSILADFLDQSIYKGLLKTSTSAMTHGLTLPGVPSIGLKGIAFPMIFLSTEKLEHKFESPGKYKGYYNTSEAEVIAELIASFASLDVTSLGYSENNPMTIGVITYYVGQSREINKHLRTVEEIEKERGWRYKVPGKPIKIRVSIVDRFQGQEQDIVILSMTRCNKIGSIGFLKNLQRINVSLSRAKQNLLIVGNARFFRYLKVQPVPVLKQLADYAHKKKLIRFVTEGAKQ